MTRFKEILFRPLGLCSNFHRFIKCKFAYFYFIFLYLFFFFHTAHCVLAIVLRPFLFKLQLESHKFTRKKSCTGSQKCVVGSFTASKHLSSYFTDFTFCYF